MNVTISLDFDAIRDDILCAFANRLSDLGYTDEQITALEKSFEKGIDGGYMDATFEIEMNADETEVRSCALIGG